MEDFGRFQACLSGRLVAQNNPACQRAKLNGDDYVDQADMALFLGCLTGSHIPENMNCLQCEL